MAEFLVDASVSTGGARLLADFLVDARVSTAGDGKKRACTAAENQALQRWKFEPRSRTPGRLAHGEWSSDRRA